MGALSCGFELTSSNAEEGAAAFSQVASDDFLHLARVGVIGFKQGSSNIGSARGQGRGERVGCGDVGGADGGADVVVGVGGFVVEVVCECADVFVAGFGGKEGGEEGGARQERGGDLASPAVQGGEAREGLEAVETGRAGGRGSLRGWGEYLESSLDQQLVEAGKDRL